MAAAAGPAATGISLAATGLSAMGSVDSGQAAAAGDEQQAQNALQAAQIGQLKATQTDTNMRQNLTSSLANILAVRASAGLNPNSPTGAAINANVEGRADINRTTAIDSINAQVTSDQDASAFYTQSANNALMGGDMGAFGAILKGIGGAIPH